MKKMLMTLAMTAVLLGCNKTTTTGTGMSTRTGERVTKKLTVMAANDQTVARGATDKVTVTVNRDNFNDPVTVTLSGLPKGVTVSEKDLVIPASGNTVTATLVADKEAAVGDHNVTITAKAEGVEENKQTFKLTVK
jgi:hypothetical protein